MKEKKQMNINHILEEARKAYKRSHPCPPADVLFDFAHDRLSKQEQPEIKPHIEQCEDCQELVQQMKADQREWDQMLANAYHTVRDEIVEKRKPIDLREFMAEELWPEGTGVALTAATTSITKERSFHVQDGTIKVVCNWGKATETDPAYIMLRWEGDLSEDAQFRILFIHRETRNVLYEIPPDKIRNLRKSDRTFTSERLGFDPLQEEWAIIVM